MFIPKYKQFVALKWNEYLVVIYNFKAMRLFVIGLLCLLALSCSKNDDGPSTNPNLALVTGTWNLSTLQISPAQDIDEDGTTTNNILEELNCISATLVINENNTWDFNGNDVIITTITGGLFKFFCDAPPRSNSGVWDLQDNILRLSDGVSLTELAIDAENLTLTNTIGESLPGLQAEVYTKQ
ncbi:hypothetical protein [Robiginitalea sp. IMCC43444]|uniref:hypothetical protein n=1 Tax=Robiginitalea sp. IMCC43444 TaxID=3459121 RepID=UPI004042AEBD